MWNVLAALVPALACSYLFFGWRALLVVAVAGAFAVAAEWGAQKVRGVPVTVGDGSALLAGVLLAMTLPPNVPLYIPAIGSVFAIAVAKHCMGGLGANIWNPALAGRAFLMASFPTHMAMAAWPVLRHLGSGNVAGTPGVDVVTGATPLEVMKRGGEFTYRLVDLAAGHIPGSIGETSAIALLAGGIFLILKRYVDWRLPLSYIGTVALLVFVLPAKAGDAMTPLFSGHALVHLLSGGLFLGAFFMATDMVTSPMTRRGQVVFGIGCGILTAAIRLYGGYPEGVNYAILLMNTFVPIIDRFTVPRTLGG
jgi:electron transport complex protein RnfD